MPLFGLFIDPLYIAILAPALILSAYASFKVRSTFAKYSREPVHSGMSGADVARAILRKNGIMNVRVETSQGAFSDHYDPGEKVVRLSPDVYQGRSVASVAVAAHEVGHVLQDAHEYAPMVLRSAAVPIARFGSSMSWIFIIGGFLLQFIQLAYIGVILFLGVVLFQLVTLPVEFNASSRAKETLLSTGLVDQAQAAGVSKVLNAAAMTYVAAALSAVLTLLYFLIRLGLLGGRDD